MFRFLCSAFVLVLLAACAATGPGPGSVEVRHGRVTQVEEITIEGDHQLGLGAVAGAVVGGLLGNQIGSGSGRALATVGGAVAGGYVGDRMQNKQERQPGQRVLIQLDDGSAVSITQPADPYLRPGQRVRIDGDGNKARVTRL